MAFQSAFLSTESKAAFRSSAILFLSCNRYLHGQSVHDRIAEGMHEGDMFEKKLHDFYYYVALSI